MFIIKIVKFFVKSVFSIFFWLLILGVFAVGLARACTAETRENDDWRNDMSEVIRDYKRCMNEPDGTYIVCPMCRKKSFEKHDGNVFCSNKCRNEFYDARSAFENGQSDRRIVESYGKNFK